jgi:hypothetical protein
MKKAPNILEASSNTQNKILHTNIQISIQRYKKILNIQHENLRINS